MGTQFLLSLIGGAIAGGGLLLIAGKYAYKWYKKETITISGEIVAISSILILTGAVSAYKLAESSYHLAGEGVEYAKDGVKSALHTGQQVIEKTLKWGTVTLLEGIGQPYHDYQKKWKEDNREDVGEIEIRLVSKKQEIVGDQKRVHLVLDIKNVGSTELDLNRLFSEELVVLTDKNNNAYSLKKLNYQESIVKAGEHSQREMDIMLPKEIELQQINTPLKQLLLLER